MTTQNSRLITHPDTVYPDGNHAVVLIDIDGTDIENVSLFCMGSIKNYDLYLYRSDLNDTDWLSSITNLSDVVLINETSNTIVENAIKIGATQTLTNTLMYFQEFDVQQ